MEWFKNGLLALAIALPALLGLMLLLCEEHELAHHWRAKQRQARIEAAKTTGVCDKL